MSFLREVKEEIIYFKDDNLDMVIAEIHGLLDQNFKIHVSKYISLTIIKENIYLAKRLSFLISEYLDEKFEIKIISNKSNIKRQYSYIIHFPNAETFLTKIKMLKENTFVFNSKEVYEQKNCRASYLRGEFISCGLFSDPSKNYHLEFRKNDKSSALKLKQVLNYYKLNAKVIERKNYFIVYVKEADRISDFLKIISAHSSVFMLEDLIIEKDIKNTINRKQNCEMANLNKTINASVKQINDINFIYENYGAEYLSEELRQLADIRTQNLDLSLIEIGKKFCPPLSKSSVNYKLKKISKIASNLRGEHNGTRY